MKQLLLLRHAKSSRDNPALKDFDRPLAARGLKDAARMGKFLQTTGCTPQQVISSPAERAAQTSRLFAEAAGLDSNTVVWNEDLYYGSTTDYLITIRQVPDPVGCVLIVGHNPMIEDTLNMLYDRRKSSTAGMPTAALACLELSMDSWKQVKPETCRLKWFMRPRQLKI